MRLDICVNLCFTIFLCYHIDALVQIMMIRFRNFPISVHHFYLQQQNDMSFHFLTSLIKSPVSSFKCFRAMPYEMSSMIQKKNTQHVNDS